MATKINHKDLLPDFTKSTTEAKALLTVIKNFEQVLKASLKISKEILSVKGNKTEYENLKKTNKAINQGKEAVKGLNELEKQKVKILKEQETLNAKKVTQNSKIVAQNEKLKQDLQSQAKSTKDLVKWQNAEVGSVNKLNSANALLRKRRDALNLTTEKGRKKLDLYNKAIDRNNKAIVKSADAMKKQKMNVGNYTNGVKDAISQTGIFSGTIGKLNQIKAVLNAILVKNTIEEEANTVSKVANATATKTMTSAQKAMTLATNLGTKSLKVFKVALMSSGIGAIVLALGALVAMFTRTQDGIESTGKAMKKVTTTINVLLDRLANIGTALKMMFTGDWTAGLNMLKEAFKGIGDEIKTETEAVDELQEALYRLIEAENDFIVTKARKMIQFRQLRLDAKDEQKSELERIKLLRLAKKEIVDVSKEEEELKIRRFAQILQIKDVETARKRLNSLVEDGIKLTREEVGLSISTEEDRREALEVASEVLNVRERSLKLQLTVQSEIFSLNNKIQKQRELLLKQRNEENKIDEIYLKNKEKEKEDLKEITKLTDAYIKEEERKRNLFLANIEKEAEERENALDLIDSYNKARRDKNQEALDKDIEARKSHLDTLKQMAVLGSKDAKDSIANEEKRIIEAQARKEKLMKKERQQELIMSALKSFNTNLATEGDSTKALTKTIKDMTVLTALVSNLPTFFEGTEDTGKGGDIDSKGGKMAVIHPNERIMTKEQNKMTEGLSNWELANLGQMHKMKVPQINTNWQSNERILQKFDELKRTLENTPHLKEIDFDRQNESLIYKIESKNKILKNHIKLNKLC